MQLYAIVMIGVLLLADGGLGLATGALRGLGGWSAAALVWAPVLLVVAVTFGGVEYCRSRLASGGAPGPVLAAERLARWARWLLLAHFAAVVLVFGWLDTVRAAVGDIVLADELVAMLPPLVGLAGTWWAYYPIERRVRDAVLLRQLDLGRAIFPTPTRGQYVLTQLRLHVLFLLVPILLIIAAAELIDVASGRWGWPNWLGDVLTLMAAMSVVLMAPLLTRVVLEVEPVPHGPLREDLARICRQHRVKVRSLLVWKTQGSMINAAVMGLIGRLRYVLLTDALLESMSRRQVEAVMAHEIGHIRRHHMPWLLASLLAVIVVATMPLYQAQLGLAAAAEAAGEVAAWMDAAATAMVGAGAAAVFLAFGWVSRRFERQADTFSARHMSGPRDLEEVRGVRVTAEAAETVSSALETIARLNAVPARRRSWRHGSIAWRQAYLKAIVDRSPGSLSIDRQVRWIKRLAVVVLAVGLGWGVFQSLPFT
ncbi:MAG: M48 family metallopeptidase [Planctomycetota bacterium]|jgi:Zn-dependent protease with chaperone function